MCKCLIVRELLNTLRREIPGTSLRMKERETKKVPRVVGTFGRDDRIRTDDLFNVTEAL